MQEVNWVLIGVLAVLILFMIHGYQKGFIRLSISMVSLIITIGLSAVITGYVSEYIQKLTPVKDEWKAGILGFLLSFIIITIIIKFTVMSLDVIANLPIIKGINKTAGILLGLAQALVLIWIVFLGVELFSGKEISGMFMDYISQNEFLKFLYDQNIIMKLIA